MTAPPPRLPRAIRPVPAAARHRQRGVVLMFSLIALLILLIVAVAMTRSFQTAMFTSGNIAFKRDLQNQSERALATVLPKFDTGGVLATAVARADHKPAENYSATMLPTNAQGIPLDLLKDDAGFSGSWTAGDLVPTTDNTLSVRYVIDRLCSATGNETTLGSAQCALGDNPTPSGTSASNLQGAERTGVSATNAAATLQSVIYRISVRVTGPRNTQSFFQSTFTVPS